MKRQDRRHAVVLGGSMTGILAARVLAESFRDVVVVDRDALLGVREARRGVPHARHLHSLQARGLLIFEELFPNLTSELSAAGIPAGDLGEIRWYLNARRLQPAKTGLFVLMAPRPILEDYVRARVAALSNVTFRERCDILGLEAAPGGDQIIGVRVQGPHSESGGEVLQADLVVDATGRGSRTPAWLESLGYQRPPEERVKTDLAYATRYYRTKPEWFNGVPAIACPGYPRGAFFGQVGADVCMLSATGMLGDYPPTDPQAFLEFIKSLPVPDIYEAVREGEALNDPVSFRFPASVRRRYERLTRLPAGLIGLGDAVCSFNPVYGQGMSVAALQALTLRKQLRAQSPIQPGHFFAGIAGVINTAWGISAGGDLGIPGVKGRRTLNIRVNNAYTARAHHAATKDPKVTGGLMRVIGLMDPPRAVMRPGMLLRVFRRTIRRPGPGTAWQPPASATASASGQVA